MAGSVRTVSTLSTVPLLPPPRLPLGTAARDLPRGPESRARHWYENELGWATVPGRPLRLVTGLRFDVLDVPAEAGADALRHLAPGSPVALRGDRMRLLVAAGSAEELPGVLDWLEWGPLALDLEVLGAGGAMEAPVPPGGAGVGRRPGPGDPARTGSVQGAAAWLRPPVPGGEVEVSLPALPAMGSPKDAPDLVRLVDTVAARCHRIRLRRLDAGPPACRRNQPLAFS
ncbi:SCO3374 family protein [Streptomyces collinus]|uniref:SCO3374 family protein n=1 Tax=Streptomyces collinus TaxID=42684 RepID=UPI0018728A0B|nr:SCO3374 family protein [Streptomyces collinus]